MIWAARCCEESELVNEIHAEEELVAGSSVVISRQISRQIRSRPRSARRVCTITRKVRPKNRLFYGVENGRENLRLDCSALWPVIRKSVAMLS